MVTSIKGNDTSTFGGNIDVPQIVTDAPMFRALMSANQTVSFGTWTKVNFDTKDYDLTSDYDTTNKRFTPSVEGYYQVNLQVSTNDQTGSMMGVIYKNGILHSYGSRVNTGTSSTAARTSNLSMVVYMNGTTDYIEGWILNQSNPTASMTVNSNLANCHFDAYLARAV